MIFAIYIALAIAYLRTPGKATQDHLMWGGLLVTILYFWTYRSFWKSDMTLYGKPDAWVRFFCYLYTVFFVLGTLLSVVQLGTQYALVQ
jgi:hypothetical protein